MVNLVFQGNFIFQMMKVNNLNPLFKNRVEIKMSRWNHPIFPLRRKWRQENWRHMLLTSKGFPGGTSGKEPACQCSRLKRCTFDSWVRKIPWSRKWQPSRILAWRIPWTEEPSRLQSMGLHRVGHNWGNLAHTLPATFLWVSGDTKGCLKYASGLPLISYSE